MSYAAAISIGVVVVAVTVAVIQSIQTWQRNGPHGTTYYYPDLCHICHTRVPHERGQTLPTCGHTVHTLCINAFADRRCQCHNN